MELRIEDREAYNIRGLSVILCVLLSLILICTLVIEDEDRSVIFYPVVLCLALGWGSSLIFLNIIVIEKSKLRIAMIPTLFFYIPLGGFVCWFGSDSQIKYQFLLLGSGILLILSSLTAIMLYTVWHPKPLLIIDNQLITVKQQNVPPIGWYAIKNVKLGESEYDNIELTTDNKTYRINSSYLSGYNDNGLMISRKYICECIRELCKRKGIPCN
jgi:hypothetical protein